MSLLEVNHVAVHFPVRSGVMQRVTGACRAVDGVSLHLGPGETLGLVGESGCGKSTLGKAIVRLLEPTAGTIHFQGQNITHASPAALRPLRRDLQMIFQDPAESLNPRHSVREILEEPFLVHHADWSREQRFTEVVRLLDQVGLPRTAADKYPFEFSGGQRQRIGIARAIALKPKLIVCDEAVSALDVSVQSQVLNLLLELQRQLGLAYLFISHNLAVVRHVSDRVAVMYLGKIVELAPADAIYQGARHAYTQALLAAHPEPTPGHRNSAVLLEGDVPSPLAPPPGCAFGHRRQHPAYAQTIGQVLPLREIAPSHFVQHCPCCVAA